MRDLQLQPDRLREAERALEATLRTLKLSRRQKELTRACPEVLRRLAHLSSVADQGEVAEDVAADAIPRVARRLQHLAGPERSTAVEQFFESNRSALLPICTAVAVALQGGPTDLRTVARRIRQLLDQLADEEHPRMLARFGPVSYCWRRDDSIETILSRLRAGPQRRRRWPKLCELASAAEVEALARRWEDYRPAPASQNAMVVGFDVRMPNFSGIDLHSRTPQVIHFCMPWDVNAPGGKPCSGWEVVCPDGRVRHYPYHNQDDAQCDADGYSEEGCQGHYRHPNPLQLQNPPCPEGPHTVRPIGFAHGSGHRGET